MTVTEWQRVESELREEFERLEKRKRSWVMTNLQQLVENLRLQVDQAIRSKNVKVGHEILEQINTLFIQLTMMYQCIG